MPMTKKEYKALTNRMPKKGDLVVWWVPQVPMKAFVAPVKTLAEARLLLRTLARYDIFQLENKVKPDFCNAGGLVEWDGKDFPEFYADSESMELYDAEFDSLTDSQIEQLDKKRAKP